MLLVSKVEQKTAKMFVNELEIGFIPFRVRDILSLFWGNVLFQSVEEVIHWLNLFDVKHFFFRLFKKVFIVLLSKYFHFLDILWIMLYSFSIIRSVQ